MANWEKIINDKAEKDAEWKAAKQSERETATGMQEAGIINITSIPETYAQYLAMQGDNVTYSPGNIAIAMLSMDGVTVFGTNEKWEKLGRTVKPSEVSHDMKIYTRTPNSNFLNLTSAYDITQTQGRELKPLCLKNDSEEMEAAMSALINYSIVPITVDRALDCPALYDENAMELALNPDFSEAEMFPAVAAEIALCRIHAKGANDIYKRSESTLDAQSIAYILCRRFGIECAMPDVRPVLSLYEDWTPQERRSALDAIHKMSKDISGSIERKIAPPSHSRTTVQTR